MKKILSSLIMFSLVVSMSGAFSVAQAVDKINICHYDTELETYELININVNGLNGHDNHENDIIPAPEGGCPGDEEENECGAHELVLMSEDGDENAVATFEHEAWTADNDISGATWIWSDALVQNPDQEETEIFPKDFDIPEGAVIDSAELLVAADNNYTVDLNGSEIASDSDGSNFVSANVVNIATEDFDIGETNTVTFTVTNLAADTTDPQANPAGLIYKLSVKYHVPCGSIKITKYECPEGTVVTRSLNGVGETVPENCDLEEGATFGYVQGEQTNANPPFPELDADITEAGATDGSGMLSIENLSATGRYLVMETDGAGNQLPYPDSEVLGLYCEGDGDTSGNNDNQELTFVSDNETTQCVAYNKIAPEPNPNDATISALKVVCDSEDDLPNWGAGGVNITATTAAEFLAADLAEDQVQDCRLEDWTFEWAPSGTANPGNNLESAGSPWTSFTGTVTIPVPEDPSFVWVREQLPDGYLEFSGDITNPHDEDVTAELYCNTDVFHYDNYDRVDNMEEGGTYHCIGFNVETERPVENSCPVPSALEDEDAETVNNEGSEEILQSILDGEAYGVDVDDDQKQYQLWNVPANSEVTIDSKFIDGISAHPAVFGYYTDSSMANFVPVFKTATIVGYESVPLANTGPFTVNTGEATSVGFAIKSFNSASTQVGVFATENSLSDGSGDQAVVYNPSSNKYVIAFEDLVSGDFDYNDLVVEVMLSCSACDATETSQTIVSDALTLEGADAAVPVSFTHAAWTAVISGATWIWGEDPVSNPQSDLTETFTRTFTIAGTPTGATLDIAADNTYSVSINGNPVNTDNSEDNYSLAGQDSGIVIPSSYLLSGSNTITFTVKNIGLADSNPETNPAGLLYKLVVNESDCPPDPTDPNTAEITVVKNTVGGDGTFNFQVTGQAGFSLTTNAETHTASTTLTVSATTNSVFNVNELDIPGWTLTDVSCVYENEAVGQAIEGGKTVTLDAGDHITCTFTNTADSQDPSSADLSVTKTVDDSTPDEGQSVNYTITVTNNGSSNATGVVVNDLLPAGLTYTTHATAEGNYDEVTGVWTIGNLANGASATLSLAATVNSETSGDTIVNTATADGSESDNVSGNNSATASVTVNSVQSITSSGGGGRTSGGRAGGSSSGLSAPAGEVLGASTDICGIAPDAYMRKGHRNEIEDVKVVQAFLNNEMGSALVIDGMFGPLTEAAVKAFQLKYKSTILDPWGITEPTGIVYKTTLVQMKNLICPVTILPIPTDLINWSANPAEVPPKV